jgi:4,5-DOPA dioxygenase extradiol
MNSLPALFISHGAPTMIITPGEARDFLADLGHALERPKAILAVSAHWETDTPAVTGALQPQMIYDFNGFPRELYEIRYPAPGSAWLANRTSELLAAAGFQPRADATRGLDHGAWVPLKLMYPDADIPVVQLSLQTPLGPRHHLRLGEALRPLRSEGVLLLASGGASHNLRELQRDGGNNPPPAWVSEFGEWLAQRTQAGDVDELLDYRMRAPHAARNHPTEEHFLPFFVALGSRSSSAKRVHSSTTFGALAMDAYEFR